MCRWHKHAMKQAATNPATGEFDAAKYAVGITAMALFRIEQNQFKMPEIFEIDGFNPEEVLTDEAKAAFERSGLARPMAEIENKLAENVAKISAALDEVAHSVDVSMESFSIEDDVSIDGYKATCCAPADPRENGPFLDAAVVNLFKGYDDAQRSYASGALELISADELEALQNDSTIADHDKPYIPKLEPIRQATALFLDQPNMAELLEETFAYSIAYIFQTAQDDLDNGRGLTGPSNCIMCEGTKGRKAVQEGDDKPETGKRSIKEAFTSAVSGIGGAFISHIGCIAAPAVASALGGTISASFMAASMYVTSPIIAIGATMGIDKLQGKDTSSKKLLGAAALAMMVSYGINQYVGHDHHEGHENHQHHNHAEHVSTIMGIDKDDPTICRAPR